MLKLTINKEQLPTRCEVCHKADCYEPIFNFCSRCSESLTKISFDIIESTYSKEALYDWQVITLKDAQIIWLKLSLNFLGLVTILYLSPALSKFIFSLPPNVLELFALGIPELFLVCAFFLVCLSNKKMSQITKK